MNQIKRNRLINKNSSWGIIISMGLVLVILVCFLFQLKMVSPDIDLICRLDTISINRICIDQKEIFKVDSNHVMRKLKKEFTIGKHEIIIYDEFGEVIKRDSVFLDVDERYDLLIFEKNHGGKRTIEVSLKGILLE